MVWQEGAAAFLGRWLGQGRRGRGGRSLESGSSVKERDDEGIVELDESGSAKDGLCGLLKLCSGCTTGHESAERVKVSVCIGPKVLDQLRFQRRRRTQRHGWRRASKQWVTWMILQRM